MRGEVGRAFVLRPQAGMPLRDSQIIAGGRQFDPGRRAPPEWGSSS